VRLYRGCKPSATLGAGDLNYDICIFTLDRNVKTRHNASLALPFVFSLAAEGRHLFTLNDSDWGFSDFASVQEILNPDAGFLVDDVVIIKADVTVLSTSDKWNLDVRKETGFVGLKNQGATCYMNSVLQYLYNLSFFRNVGG
jgi:hypothetical protein